MKTAQERFDEKVTRTATCWLWTGATLQNGYGQLKYGDRVETAHRVSVLLDGRVIPIGMQVDHLCRVKNCVNPEHLEVVTPRENTLRAPTGRAQENARKTHCHRGHLLEGANLIQRHDGRGCRACMAIHRRDYQARRKAVV